MSKEDSPFAYEEVFSLILSMTQQSLESKDATSASREHIEDYFSRLTKLSLGEYEFARRLAFEGIKAVRIAPYEVLWKRFGQHPPEDFIIKTDDGLACVDVKYYNPSKMLEKILIPEKAVRNVLRFSKEFKLKKAFIAIKRFERWYLLDAEEIRTLSRHGKYYSIEISWARKHHKLLKEEYCVFNLGTVMSPLDWCENGKKIQIYPSSESTMYGVYYHDIEISKNEKTLKIVYGKNGKTRKYDDLNYHVLKNLREKLDKNIRKSVTPAHENWQTYITGIEDLCPTVFTISDGIDDFTAQGSPETMRDKVYSTCLTKLQDAQYIYIGKEDVVKFYVVKLFIMLRKKVKDELERESITKS